MKMLRLLICSVVVVICMTFTACVSAAEIPIEPETIFLRSGTDIEWDEFRDAKISGERLDRTFALDSVPHTATLRLRQRDVKQRWLIELNGKEIGELVRDENYQVLLLSLPDDLLKQGENQLSVFTKSPSSDDIQLESISILDTNPDTYLGECDVEIQVLENETETPCRLTILDDSGALQPVLTDLDAALAVRTGVIYCKGTASLRLPQGIYEFIASRGSEYSIDRVEVACKGGESIQRKLRIVRQVDTAGYVACDTHVHTREFSGHGDATANERVLTIAGEGIELPITTEHNRHSSYRSHADKLGVARYFTPVMGNEFTTKVGHFNLFPVREGTPPPDHKSQDWPVLFGRIFATSGVQIAILNHPEDLHGGYRPFGPENVNAASMRNLDQWELKANAMEIINSGAQQTDMLRLVGDWMRLLNRGMLLTPIGSSDSHDVSRYIIGQGRTYVRCDDSKPSDIDIGAAVGSVQAGRVSVSLGLYCELSVNSVSPGALVARASEYEAHVRVQGPDWIAARSVSLFRNGNRWKTIDIRAADRSNPGTKFDMKIQLPRISFDEHIVAVAIGDPVTELFWPIAKPYQPRSGSWKASTMAVSGCVWLDADGDGMRTSALQYAKRHVKKDVSIPKLLASLREHDQPTATMAADLLDQQGISPLDASLSEALLEMDDHNTSVVKGFMSYADAWRRSQQARVKASR